MSLWLARAGHPLCPEPYARVGWQTPRDVGEAASPPQRSPAASGLAARATGAYTASGAAGGGVLR